ncbi:hypothetical protein MC885_003652 [Smutsia gigantea]|nr:hypothetical protein MC885_003652 [Smutsia gigantea]
MAAIPSSGSLVATHDYNQRRLGSPSTSCGSAKTLGKPSPTTPVSPRLTRVTGWQASFSGNPLSPSWPPSESPQSSSGMTTCDLVQEAMRKQPGRQPSKAKTGPPS